MHAQPAFHDIGLFVGQQYSIADKGLYLPSELGLTVEEIDYVCETIKAIQDDPKGS